VYGWCVWCVVVVGSRPAAEADLAPSGSRCGVETSLASPTLVVWVWLEAFCPIGDCGRGSTRRESESVLVLEVGSSPSRQAGHGRPRQSPELPVLLQLGAWGEDGTDWSVSMG